MGTTPAEKITEYLTQALDVELLSQYYVKQGLMLGLKKNEIAAVDGGVSTTGEWPIFPNFRMSQVPIGASRRILDTAYIHESRLRSSDPEPEFPQVGRLVSEARKQIFLSRAKDDYGEWSEDVTQGFQNGLMLGRGGCEAHAVDGKMGFQKVCLTHIPVTHIITDPYERNVTKSQFVGLMRLVRVDDAVAKWGEDAKNHVRTMREQRQTAAKLEVVPVTTWYDVGIGKGYPTRAIVLGNVSNKPVSIEESKLDFIPFAWCEGFMPAGMNEPLGATDRLMALAEEANEFDYKMRMRARQPDILIVDPSQLDPKELKALIDQFGKSNNIHVIPTKMQQGAGFEFVPAPPITQGDLEWGARIDRKIAEASGISEIDKGAALDKQATKFEVEQVQQASSLNNSGPQKQTLDYMRRCIDMTLKVAAQFDREPLEVDIDGVNVLVNDPKVPESSIWALMQEKSRTVVGTDSLSVQDDRSKRRQDYQDIAEYAGTFGQVANPVELAKRAAKKLIPDADPEDLINPMAGQVAGQPMQAGV